MPTYFQPTLYIHISQVFMSLSVCMLHSLEFNHHQSYKIKVLLQ